MFTQVEIQYADPNELDDVYSVQFKLKDHDTAQKWAHLVTIANKKYPIDDPGRFHGFYDREELVERALKKIKHTIDIINGFEPIIDRHLEDIMDQDTLNYLHHIFEVYHGLLDSQTSSFWNRSPDHVKKALADLNIYVHECESVGRNTKPTTSHAITWYKMPKVTKLTNDDYKLFKMGAKFGAINLLYTEIGKTLEDLSVDNDQYIFDTAFQPFRHISADFMVTYYDDDDTDLESKFTNMKNYYDKHIKFFADQGLPWEHPYLSPGTITVAELSSVSDDIISKIKSRQWVKAINIT
jgi:hypothetical protein